MSEVIKKGSPVLHKGMLSNVIEVGVKKVVIRNVFDQEDKIVDFSEVEPARPEDIDSLNKIVSSDALMTISQKVLTESYIDDQDNLVIPRRKFKRIIEEANKEGLSGVYTNRVIN